MTPIRFERNDLLDDARFWAMHYEHWVKPRVGDCFDDGEQYFFSVSEMAVTAFSRHLADAVPQGDHYPEYSVLLPLGNGWRVGVVLSMFPEDFQEQDVVLPPSSDELIVFGVNGGNFLLPALRWEELLILRDAVVPNTAETKAKAVLLFFPAICISSQMNLAQVRQVVEEAWRNSGVPISHASELVDRPIEDFVGLYPNVNEATWSKHPSLGWINDGHYSLRNPKERRSESVIPTVRELFTSLASEE